MQPFTCLQCRFAPEELQDLVPKRATPVAVDQEVKGLQATRPPPVAVIASTAVLTEVVAVEVEQSGKERDDADRVDHDEDSSNYCVGSIRAGFAVDGEAVPTDDNLRCWPHKSRAGAGSLVLVK